MKRKDAWFIALILLALGIVFFQLFTLEKAFLSGDHREQQYPWAQFYQSEIRQFRLPWWTTQIHCGFPLLAEGQIGAFYPLNFLFLLLLPIQWAYNYEILFQYFLGAILFYVYLRHSGISIWGSFFATLVYLFGSTQGGYFYYNLISQKTVIWLPLTLILLERLKEKKDWHGAFFLSLVFAVQIFAGYLQVAIYSIFYSCLYFFFLWWGEKSGRGRGRFLALFTASGCLAIFFSLVQLLPTFELAMFSSRANALKELAYVGSMTPIGWFTLFYPSWDGFLGSELYVGILGLFFVFVSLFSVKEPRERFFVFAAAFFLLLALGKFSPLYRAIIEVTHFYSFRTPIKFLFFATFSLACLAGFGFDKFFNKEELRNKHASSQVLTGYRLFLLLGGVMLLLPFTIHFFLDQYRPLLLPFLKQYVAEHIYGQAGHPHALEFYMQKAEGFYEQVILLAGLSGRDTREEWLLLGFCLVFIRSTWFVPEGFLKKCGKWLCCLVLFWDLFLYGFTSIKPNYEDFDSVTQLQDSAIVHYLKKDKSLFRVMEVYQEPSENEKFPVFPNFNMLQGLEDIGAYSPLVMREYRSFLSGWGYTNDSLSIELVNPDKVAENLGHLSFLNVKYLLSARPLQATGLLPVMEDRGITLYRNDRALPRAFFLPGVSTPPEAVGDFKNIQTVENLKYGQHRVSLEVNAAEDGLLVLSDIAYPGWRVRVNQKRVPLVKTIRLFRAAPLAKGKNEVVFEYSPALYQWLGFAALLSVLAWLGVIVRQKMTGRGARLRSIIE